MEDDGGSRSAFRHVLPDSRLGKCHTTMESYLAATKLNETERKAKEYSLVVVTTEDNRILLGKKHRGFGTGMWNSFGGKLEPGESPKESACRELAEETGIQVENDSDAMIRIGTLHFTFEDSPTTMMKVHLFRVSITVSVDGNSIGNSSFTPDSSPVVAVHPSQIRGCEEITPHWFENWYTDIPLDNMFADDSVWLTRLLNRKEEEERFDGWFHFQPGGQHTNTILHRILLPNNNGSSSSSSSSNNTDNVVTSATPSRAASTPAVVTPQSTPEDKRNVAQDVNSKSYTLEQRLFHALHDNKVRAPSFKEFKEALAFCNTTRRFFQDQQIKVVLDVAGGHGALAGMFLATNPKIQRAVVIDPAQVGQGSVQRAWGKFFRNRKEGGPAPLTYRHECLRSGLPATLDMLRHEGFSPRSILVVGCHACQHLSEEIIRIACRDFGTHAAVMPCCQRDSSPGRNWKAFCKNVSIPVEQVMDILLAGKAMSWDVGQHGTSYDVRMKAIDAAITPQNRLILCKAQLDTESSGDWSKNQDAHERLALVYRKAHAIQNPTWIQALYLNKSKVLVATVSFALGCLCGSLIPTSGLARSQHLKT